MTADGEPVGMERIRLLGVISLVVVAAFVAPAEAGATGEPAERVEQFRAQFDVAQKGDGFVTYLVGAERRTDPATGEVHLEDAFIRRSQCEGAMEDIPRHCAFDGGGDAQLISFDISDQFEEATIVIRYRGRTSWLRFTSTERPIPYPDLFANTCGAVGFMVFTDFREGEAKGRVMGRSVFRAQTSDNEVTSTLIAESICL